MTETNPLPKNGFSHSVPGISVIIPAYNNKQTLPSCLDSFINQKFLNIEIILVDDCSTDGTALLCQEYASQYSYISHISLPINQGQGAARNAGLAKSKGKYILFADADDTVQPDMLHKLYEKAQKNNSDIVVCGYSRIDNANIETVLPAAQYTVRSLLTDDKIFPVPWNKLFRKDFLHQHSIIFPHSRYAEDVAFICKALVCVNQIDVCTEALYNYIIYSNSVSHNMAHRSGVFISLLDIKYFFKHNEKYVQYNEILWKLIFNHTIRYPMHLLLVSSLWNGINRKENFNAFPIYIKNLIIFLYNFFQK